MSDSNWFAARIVLESVGATSDGDERLFEDRIILLRAESEREAQVKAKAIGRESAHEYDSAAGSHVTWRFKELLDVKPLWLDSIEDGSEVYYAFLREPELDQIRRIIQSRIGE
jgi:hypothetical protein